MVRYFKIYDSKDVIYVTVDDSGAVIIRDKTGRKIFLSRYQAKLMKFGIENIVGDKIKLSENANSDVHIEEITKEEMDKILSD